MGLLDRVGKIGYPEARARPVGPTTEPGPHFARTFPAAAAAPRRNSPRLDGRLPLAPRTPCFLSPLKARSIALLVLLILAVVSACLPGPPAAPEQATPASPHTPLHEPSAPGIAPVCPSSQANASFGVSLLDAQTGQPLCERNPNGIAQPASTTKVMAVLLTAQHLRAHHLSLDTSIQVQAEDRHVEWDAAVAFLQTGHRYSVRTLVYMVSLLSAADATMALARFVAGSRAAFLALMNREAQHLGMTRTHYTSPYGYARTAPGHWQQGEDTSIGNYSSAHDMALLMRAFARYPEMVQIFGAAQYHQDGFWLDRANSYIITDSWIGLSASQGERGRNLRLPFQVLAVKKGCMWCAEDLHKISYVLLARYQQQTIAAGFLYTTQNYSNPRVGDMLPVLLWAFHLCKQPAYLGYCS